MSVALRVVLDQLVTPSDPELADASRGLLSGLLATIPAGCEVEAIVPSGPAPELPDQVGVRRLSIGRRELAAAWQMGVAPGVGGGMIHAPSLFAPLVRHDRVHDHDQTVVTLWDLRAWDAPERLPKTTVTWQRAMLRRALKHADAIVVPAHSLAERLAEIAPVGDRVRVIAGAPSLFSGADGGSVAAVEGPERHGLPERYVALAGDETTLHAGFSAVAATDADALVLDAAEGAEPRIADIAAAAGLPETRVHVRPRLAAPERAVAVRGALAMLLTDTVPSWPWRGVEAMAASVPVVAVDSGVHRDVLADGAGIGEPDALPSLLQAALGPGAERARVLASDRARAFSWEGAAERVWALHADL